MNQAEAPTMKHLKVICIPPFADCILLRLQAEAGVCGKYNCCPSSLVPSLS